MVAVHFPIPGTRRQVGLYGTYDIVKSVHAELSGRDKARQAGGLWMRNSPVHRMPAVLSRACANSRRHIALRTRLSKRAAKLVPNGTRLRELAAGLLDDSLNHGRLSRRVQILWPFPATRYAHIHHVVLPAPSTLLQRCRMLCSAIFRQAGRCRGSSRAAHKLPSRDERASCFHGTRPSASTLARNWRCTEAAIRLGQQ